ncbi:MAG: EAL domain-containing protein [Ramlibacter sp.]|nr:EAL domain-containing protein [Ramlibacter sp.]
MPRKPVDDPQALALRDRAEGLARLHVGLAQPAGEAELQRMLHEMQVYQIELELQNEELLSAQTGLQQGAAVFQHSYDGIMVCDPRAVIVNVNPAFTRITGYSPHEAIGRTPGNLLHSGQNGPEFYRDMWQMLQQQDHWRGELINRRKNGTLYAQSLSIAAVRDGSGGLQHFVGVFSDISQVKAHEAELDRIAHYDPLTGLPNRRLFADRLETGMARARASGRTLAICYLDLDGFKQVNDRFGHDAGDMLLMEVTRRLQDALRANDTVARLGGDEFVLLVDVSNTAECVTLLARVLAVVSEATVIQDERVTVSASIGVTLYPSDDASPDTLLRHADQAMYLAKERGKNRVHLFDLQHDLGIRAGHEQRAQLQRALDGQELLLHFQPRVDLASGRVVGAEALIRWQHPGYGLLLPAAFLSGLQDTELEVRVGEWVINAMLRQLALWQTQGLDLNCSVNISPSHLMSADFPERLAWLLAQHPDVPPARLELEILETAALSDIARAAHTLASCRRLGVRTALDDFGTGYASLALLRQLPVNVLKLDQSFVRDVLTDGKDRVLVEGVVHMAQAFGLDVVAEGVETQAHGAVLLATGCRLCQGYGIAHPMPADALPAWVARWHTQPVWTQAGSWPT